MRKILIGFRQRKLSICCTSQRSSKPEKSIPAEKLDHLHQICFLDRRAEDQYQSLF